ncbi:Pycsar system effector family protein [Fontibacter flavus]|uniref:Pycsar system effector family protein n=1 Tax=Fontibacter flavus TaxID=654838 RepID=A0ABV6FYM8_9BACT
MENSPLINSTQKWVSDYFSNQKTGKFTYHNIEHTEEVVKACIFLGKESQISEKDLESLQISAYFHDTGCWENDEDLDDHEMKSANIAAIFLIEVNELEKIEIVKGLIMATKMPQNPSNLLQKLICDADLHHFANSDFLKSSLNLKKELESLGKFEGSTLQWLQDTLRMMKQHQYFSPAAQKAFGEGKNLNIKVLEENIQNREDKKIIKAARNDMKALKKKMPDRGVETMFRLTSSNHIQLSSIADNKANILISVNSIIISILVTVLFRKFEEFPHLIIPGVILLATNLTVIIYAILATRPNVTHGKISAKDIEDKNTNLLYFGNFHEMAYSDYETGMKKMMKDADFLYSSMIKDVFYLGKVLAKKYELLRKSYTVFMYGLVLASLAFMFASLMQN